MKEYKSMSDTYRLVKEKSSTIHKARIQSSRDAKEYIKQLYNWDIDVHESVFMVLMNNANTAFGWVKISQGGITGTVIDVRIVAKYAVESLATQVILCHNHPSGNVSPSDNDKNITKKVKEGLAILDIQLLDHIIIAPSDDPGIEKLFSFADEGIL